MGHRLGFSLRGWRKPWTVSVQGFEEDHWEATTWKERRELGIPTAGRGTEGSGNGGDTDIHDTEAEYGRAIYCNATDSGPMKVVHLAARSAGVSVVVGAGRDIPLGSTEMGGGIGDKIREIIRGGVGRGVKRGHMRRRGGVSGSKRVKWSGAEDG